MILLKTILSLIVIISATLVILSRKIINSVLYLILTFFTSALLFIGSGLPFIGFIYLILYVGAISILFLFIIMLLDLNNKSKENYGFIIYISGLILLLCSYMRDTLAGASNELENIDTVSYHNEWYIQTIDIMEGLGILLYTEQLSLLILIAIIITLVMIVLINSLKEV